MLTIEALKALGADADDGLKRCMNNEAFYLRLVGMAVRDDGFERLRTAIEAGDLDEAFERAHALKGVLGNVSLTMLAEPVIAMTEELRARKDIDYSGYLDELFRKLEAVRALIEE